MAAPGYTAYHQRIEEQVIPGRRLGRHVHHDSRSLLYPYRESGSPLKDVLLARHTPILDQGDVGSCFPPGTRIRMADGSERSIEDVRLGEHVVTAEGNTGRVMRTMLRDEDGGLVRLMLWGHAHLSMTRNHPVLTKRGYIPAGELRVGDEVALTKYLAGTSEAVTVADHVTTASHRLAKGNRWSGLPGREGLKAGANPLPEKINLTPAVGRLLGLFLAEGSCDSAKAKWCYGAHEVDTLVAETVQLLRSEWGIEAHVQPRANNSIFVTVYGTGWTRLLSSLCGNGAGLKRPHPHLMAGPRDFLAAMLEGWLAGDGHVRVRHYKRTPLKPDTEGVTISADLALAMYDIAQALGRRPVIDHRESPQNQAAMVRRPRWTVTMAGGDCNYKSRQDDAHVWRKVRELRLEDYVGPVYNLSVEGDESYVAEGVGVHNCTGNAETGALGTDPLYSTLSPDQQAQLNEALALALYSAAETIDGDGPYPPQDNGSTGLSVCKAAKNAGLISGYVHCLSLTHVLDAISAGHPVIIGSNWYDSMDSPDSSGLVTISPGAQVRGGHEYLARGIDTTRKLVFLDNSWGTSYGVEGSFSYSWDTLHRLLSEQGDGTVSVPLTQPAPQPVPPSPQPPGPDPAALLEELAGVIRQSAASALKWLSDHGI